MNDNLTLFGFNFARNSAHTLRTIMLDEIQTFLTYVNNPTAAKADYSQAVENDNCLAKRSGKTLKTWLREKFFTRHCKLFHHRPFFWQIWGGLTDVFSASVNHHKFDKKLLKTLIYTHLVDWISRQKKEGDRINDHHLNLAEKRTARENIL